MGVTYNRKRYRVQAKDINRVEVSGSTIISQGDVNGGYEITVRADNFGCGNPSSGWALEFKDPVPWKKNEFELMGLGSAGCWSISHGYGWGALPSPFTSTLMNLLPYDETVNKDRTYNHYKTYELVTPENLDPGLANSYKTVRCDPAATPNWFALNTTEYRSFKMIRSRDLSNKNLAGLYLDRSCTETGSNALTIIKNIFFIH